MTKWIKMTDDEFREHINTLTEKIGHVLERRGIRVDYTCPLLRSGAVPAVYIANILNIVKMAPIQVKIVEGQKSPQVLVTPTLTLKTNKAPLVFLLIDATYGSGGSAKVAIKTIKQQFPESPILFACIAYRGSSEPPKDVEEFIYTYEIDDDELPLYPWEILENEQNHPDDLQENIYY